jgi:hypothetical protein
MSRVLNSINTPTEQVALVAAGNEDWHRQIVGRMRLDLVLFRTVCIHDSHLFDGAALLRLRPTEFLSAISRVENPLDPPLVINCRAASLQDSLAELLLRRGPHAGDLHGFVFKIIGDTDAANAISRQVTVTSPDELTGALAAHGPVHGVANFLEEAARRVGVDAGTQLELARSGWDAWIAAANRGLVKQEQWDGRLDARAAVSSTYHDPHDFPATYLHFRELCRKISHERMSSSEFDNELNALSVSVAPGLQPEIERMRDWEREVRLRAIAARHRCSWSADVEASHTRASFWKRLIGQGPESPSYLEYPEAFVSRLGTLDAEDFRAAIPHELLRRWWTTGDLDARRKVLASVFDVVSARVSMDGTAPPVAHASLDAVGSFEVVAAAVAGSYVGGIPGAIIAAVPAVLPRTEGYLAHNAKMRRVVRQITEHYDRAIRPSS